VILVADTGGMLAALDADDKDHIGALDALTQAALVVISPLAITEIHQVTTSRADRATADLVISAVSKQATQGRLSITDVSPTMLRNAVHLRQQYCGVNLDLADAMAVILAAEYGTHEILTVDRRDFRAIRPLTRHTAFRILPDDL
jgi:predicted nucleic acid-binding protein